jgi:hypothetical protein
MKLVAKIPHDKYASAIFTEPMLEIKSSNARNFEGIEILTIELVKLQLHLYTNHQMFHLLSTILIILTIQEQK